MKSNYLPNSPSKEDAFGQHEKLAEALSNTILERKEGCAIGLLGEWGSGKSTVIELITKKTELAADKIEGLSYTSFVFDTWVHQGDPLRRSFLEELIEHLLANKFVDEDYATNFKAELSTKVQTISTRSQPIVKGWGYASALATIVLLPLGLNLLPEKFFWFYWRNYVDNLLPLLLVLSPLILFSICLWKVWASDRKKDEGVLDLVSSKLFFNAQNIEQNVLAQEKDKTTIEFKNKFDALLEILNDKNVVLIVTIDNIDRLESDQVKNAWSTMQTFFGQTTGRSHATHGKYFLLVPFAPMAVKSVLTESLLVESNDGVITRSQAHPNLDLNDIIRKSFEIVFYLQPPIMSKWRAFFDKNLVTAFPDLEGVKRKAVVDIFGHIPSPATTRGPREIKQFINNLVSLHKVHGADFSVPMYALYESRRDELQASIDRLIDDNYLQSYEKQLLSEEDWQTDLASLHFGVDGPTAQQLLLEAPIEEAIEQGSPEKLQELKDITGFEDVLFAILQKESYRWSEHSGDRLVKSVRALSVIEKDKFPNHDFWRHPLTEVSNFTHWGQEQNALGDCFATLLSRSEGASRLDLARRLATALRQFRPDVTEKEAIERLGSRQDASNWFDAALIVLKSTSDSDDLKIEIPSDIEFSLDVLLEIQNHPSDTTSLDRIILKNSKTEVASLITTRAKSGDIAKASCRLLSASQMENSDDFWESSYEAIDRYMRSGPELDTTSIINGLEFLNEASATFEDSAATGIVAQLCMQGFLAQHLQFARGNSGHAAKIAFGLLLHNPTITQAAQQWNSAKGFALLNDIASNPSANDEVVEQILNGASSTEIQSLFFGILVQQSNLFPLAADLISRIVDENSHLPIPVESILSARDFVKNHLPEEKRRIIIQKQIPDALLDEEYRAEATELYIWIVDALNDNTPKEFLDSLIAGLASQPHEIWEDLIVSSSVENNDHLGLLSCLRKFKKDEFLTNKAAEALKHVANQFIGSKSASDQQLENFELVASCLHAPHRLTLSADILDLIIQSSDPDTISTAIENFWSLLVESRVMEKESSRFLRGPLKELALSNSEDHVALATKIARELPEISKKSDKDYVKSFKQSLAEKAEDSETSKTIRNLLDEIQQST